MNDYFEKVKDFIYQSIAHRERLSVEKKPSTYWTDFAKNFKYVYDLSPCELLRIRYHTYHLTSDSYLTYYFANDGFKKHMTDGWRYFTEGWRLNPVDEGKIGIGVETKFGIVSHDLLRYLCAICDLKEAKLLDHMQSKSILEIGGGYGGLARMHLMQNPKISYVICDLEETLFFSVIYLSIQLGMDRVHLIDSKLESSGMENGHVYIVPQSRIEFIDDLHVNYAVSQQSLQEMTYKQTDFYFRWLSSHADFLYSCNLNDHGLIANNKQLVKDLHKLLKNTFSKPEWIGNIPNDHNRFGDNQLARAVYRCIMI